jgi:hypothetical protein
MVYILCSAHMLPVHYRLDPASYFITSANAFLFSFFFFFFFCSTWVWTQGLHLEPHHQPCFVLGVFKIRGSQTIYLGWFRTVILLISASWLTRITGTWCNYGVWTQGVTLARQAPFHWAISPALLLYLLLNRVSSLCLGWPGLQFSWLKILRS